MYLSARLEIDPSQITLIKRVKPTKIFTKLIDTLSLGQLSEKQEQETFTALNILQQLSSGLRVLDIKNIIRLSVDDYDFYLDETGEEDDLSQAMFQLKSKIDPLESEIFKTIYMVVEHEEDTIRYLIEIAVERKHRVGEYPLTISINGVITDFKLETGELADKLKQRMIAILMEQDAYDNFINTKKAQFDSFVKKLELGIKKVIKVDDIKLDTSVNIIRPKEKINTPEEIKHKHHEQPLYFGYYGLDQYFFYCWLWADLLYHHNIFCHNFNLVDEKGHNILNIGSEGFYAGDSATMNISGSFWIPKAGDITYYRNNEYENELMQANLITEN